MHILTTLSERNAPTKAEKETKQVAANMRAGKEHAHAEPAESAHTPPSAQRMCTSATSSERPRHVERARCQKGRVEDAAVQVECGRREGGGRRAAEDLLRARAHAPVRPWPSRAVRHSAPTPRPTPRPTPDLGRAMSDEPPDAAILAAGAPSRMRGL